MPAVRFRTSLVVVVLATLASYPVGWAIGQPLLLPLLNAGAAWWVMARLLQSGEMPRAVAAMLVWAATMAVAATAMSAFGWSRDARDEGLFLRPGYRDDMLRWVETGQGDESRPSRFLPQHAAHAGVFAAASLGTGGILSMPMGAVLMNSMGEYVGTMAARSAHPVASIILGWHPWSLVRIVGFVILGVVLSGVVLSRLMAFPFALSAHRGWLAAGGGLLILDVGLKAVLAPAWGRLLRGLAGW